jgi:predicted metal-dependent hydrolase
MRNSGEAHTVALKSGEIRCVIRRRKNQKYINIRITLQGEVVVSAPYGIGIERIKDSLRKKEPWIAKNLAKVAISRSDTDPLKNLYVNGVRHEVSVVRDPRRTRSVHFDAARELVTVRTKTPTRSHVEKTLERVLLHLAKERLPERTAELSALTGINFQRLFIRNQRSRWGSSSARGNLSLNWRAIMLPPQIQDYLIIHELAHQVHLNHSKSFWRLVGKWCKDYAGANKWLRDNAAFISLFRR